MATADRHVYGPRPLGALVPRVARPVFRAMGAGTGQVIADWDSIVGPMLAAVSVPRRLSAGTLTIACAGPVAMELQHYATELISRINTHLGGTPVSSLRFVQTTTLAPLPAPPVPPIPPWVAAAAENAVADLPEGELRAALAALGRAVLSGPRASDPGAAKTGAANAGTTKTEAAKTETVKTEAVKTEAAKTDAAKTETDTGASNVGC